MVILPHPSPTSPRASSSDLRKSPSKTMCIAEKKAAYVAPGARAALAHAAPTPAFAVVAPPKRFDAEANDARCVPRRPTPSHRQTRRASSPRARPEPRGTIQRVARCASTRRRALDARPRARLRPSDDGSNAAFFPGKRAPPARRVVRPRLTHPTPPNPSRRSGSPRTPSLRSPPRPSARAPRRAAPSTSSPTRSPPSR